MEAAILKIKKSWFYRNTLIAQNLAWWRTLTLSTLLAIENLNFLKIQDGGQPQF